MVQNNKKLKTETETIGLAETRRAWNIIIIILYLPSDFF